MKVIIFNSETKPPFKSSKFAMLLCCSWQDYCVVLRICCDLKMDFFFLLCFLTDIFTVEQCSYVSKVNSDQPCQLLMQKNCCLFLEYWFSSLSLSDYRSSRLVAVFTSALMPSLAGDIWILLYHECEETNSSIFAWQKIKIHCRLKHVGCLLKKHLSWVSTRTLAN